MVTFYIFATLAVVSALIVIVQSRAIYSALALIVCFGSMAILFFQLGAHFIGSIQIIVYAGAIMVLFLFVIMLLDPQSEIFVRNRLKRLTVFGLIAVILFGYLVTRAVTRPGALAPGGPVAIASGDLSIVENTKEVARLLFRDYLLPFELTSILILVAVIGAVVLSKRP